MFRNVPKPLRTLVLVTLLAGLTSCKASFRHQELDVQNHSFNQVWRGFGMVSANAGFLPEPGQTDRGQKKYESRWVERIAPFRRGQRLRLTAEFVQPKENPSCWRIRYYIEKQRVDNLKKVMNPGEDDWEAAGQDGTKEMLFLARLRGEFGLDVIERRGH